MPDSAGRVLTDVPRKLVPARCICSDHSCYCRDYARGWNDALDAVAALTTPARTPSGKDRSTAGADS